MPKKLRAMTMLKVLSLAALGLLILGSPLQAGLATSTGRAAGEAIEYVAKKFGVDLTSSAGRTFAAQAERFIMAHGDEGVRALKAAGPEAIKLTERHGTEAVRLLAAHSPDQARYFVKYADEALPVWRKFGQEGTEVLLKHPGLADNLIRDFGQKGVAIGRKLSQEQMQQFTTLAGKAASAGEKELLIDKVLIHGDRLLEFLWKHKVKLAAGAGLYVLLKEYEDAQGGTRPGVLPTMLEKATEKTVQSTLEHYPWLPLIPLAVLLIWLTRLWSALRRAVIRLRSKS